MKCSTTAQLLRSIKHAIIRKLRAQKPDLELLNLKCPQIIVYNRFLLKNPQFMKVIEVGM
jgi:hypothetical protein